MHTRVTFEIAEGDERDVLVATLAEAGYEGFEETDTALHAYIPAADFDKDVLETLSGGMPYVLEDIAQRNWNAEWEAGIEPVVVAGFCTVRAHFHEVATGTPYEVIITPKMSFGTGHHATTRLVIGAMREVDFVGKRVLDFGTGTGVLAILAAKLGATALLGIDIDEWAVDNAIENAGRNDCANIDMRLGVLDDVNGEYDVILANINRHILLAGMPRMHELLCPGGVLIMSGLLTDDAPIVVSNAQQAGFTGEQITTENGWIAIRMTRM
jgi:ribosomal protein L11 methyltransferase